MDEALEELAVISETTRPQRGLRVLLVEDDALTREVLSAALAGSGFEVHAEPDGTRVERAAAMFKPDIALIDMRLGDGVDGITVARRLKGTDDFPLLFLTSATATEDVLAAYDVGGDDYVVTPFVMAELVARMRAVLRRSGREGRTVFELGVPLMTTHAPQQDHTEDLAREHRQLERRFDALARHDLALSRFAADAAHDLRAPLQAIIGFAQLLARHQGAALDETSQRFLALIMAAAGDMANLINAALEHGQATWTEAPLTSVDSAAILERTLVHLHAEIVRTGAMIRVGHLPTVYAEPCQLGRVFQNLISNACKSARPGRAAHIHVSADRLASAWQLSVTDDGAGVPAEDRERIFELFKRGRDAEVDGGTGIGLAICRTIVEGHGGRIWVEDAPGGGSRFSFVLPDIDSS